ncbi:MAG: insulinase family protein [Verrucomicrobia bacterium]|nr:insulinase family protein [Verrucomicrobiota bacterium]
MKQISRFFTSLFLACILSPSLFGEEPSGLQDPGWTHGTLPNGLRYFIRPNAKPENRLELRLVVNAGSVLEEADQQGLAHYLEHVAFNGTENFEKNEMVKFLESLGVGFGPDLNAYTSFDETVYRLRLPTDKEGVVDDGFLILSDWAGRITASDEAIAMERGIIIEEWRGRRGGAQRVRDLKYPLIFHGTRYAERLPIGDIDVLRDFDFDRLRDFYRDWYRPDTMSVVAVGDLDVEETRARIEKNFSDLTMPEDPPERPTFPMEPHEETLVGVFHDPELTSSSIAMFWKMPPETVSNENEYRTEILRGLITDMLNQRLSEISQRSDAPFLRAGTYRGGYTRSMDVYMLHASVDDVEGAHERAMRALLEESERARIHGFTELEVDRAARRRLRGIERLYNERENTEHTDYVNEMIRHALEGIFVPGIERELELHREVLADLDPGKLQSKLASWIGPENRLVLADGPSRNGVHNLPAEETLLAVYDQVEGMEITPYVDGLGDVPLVSDLPEGGSVVSRESIDELGLEIWTLSNGVRVMLKPTDFKQDQVLMSAWSPRGTNALPLEKLPHARAADSAVVTGGLAEFSAVDLRNLLSGQIAGVSPSIGGEQSTLNGGSSAEDLETLFQLVYLHFTQPRADSDAFEAYRRRSMESVRNRLANPREVFGDLITRTMSSNHPRLEPRTPEMVREMDLETAMEIYRDRFAHAADFTFLFVGAFTLEAMEPLVSQWLGGLPVSGESESRVSLDVEVPRHEMRRVVRQGLEPISQVRMIWTSDDFEYNYASRHAVQSMMGALRIRMREVLREEMSGTYHVSVWPSMQAYPSPQVQLIVQFGCDPDQVENLIKGVHDELARFTSEPLAESYIHTVRETQRRGREVDLTRNEFWNSVLPFYLWHDEDPRVILNFEDYVSAITPESVLETAKKYFQVPDRAKFILMPAPGVEAESEAEEEDDVDI